LHHAKSKIILQYFRRKETYPPAPLDGGHDIKTNIAKRLKVARENAGLTQRQLSDALGFKDRQTVAAIEAGIRKISAEELVCALAILGKNIDYFTDPFRLVGEGSFSWRVSQDAQDLLGDFEIRAGKWLSLYRTIASNAPSGLKGAWPRTVPLSLSLTARNSYEDAHDAGRWLAGEWRLGRVPADRLESAIRKRMRALVLYVDAPYGISGAAFRLPGINAILINRSETLGRRNFDLAHELFHLLTWETIHPEHTEIEMLGAKNRSEQLANCFASALLMPERVIRSWRNALPSFPPRDRERWNRWLNARAFDLRVSTPALQWRMVQLGLLPKGEVDGSLDWAADRRTETQRLFSEDFVKALRYGLSAGIVSVPQAAALLGLTIAELAALFRAYHVDFPFDGQAQTNRL
jgi:Zn-dependent peptidase ImmA (M78 family)/transcriptional regulator with XRE-family HTH domain